METESDQHVKPIRPAAAPAPGDVQRAVKSYLKTNPSVLRADLSLLSEILEAPQHEGDNVVDLQAHLLGRMRRKIDDLSADAAQKQAKDARAYGEEDRVREAVLALADVRSFDELLETISNRLPAILEMRSIVIALERPLSAEDAIPPSINIQSLQEGDVARLLEEDRVRIFSPAGLGLEYALPATSRHALALLRIDLGPGPACLVALETAHAKRFADTPPSEAFAFLGEMIERSMRSWLDLPRVEPRPGVLSD